MLAANQKSVDEFRAGKDKDPVQVEYLAAGTDRLLLTSDNDFLRYLRQPPEPDQH